MLYFNVLGWLNFINYPLLLDCEQWRNYELGLRALVRPRIPCQPMTIVENANFLVSGTTFRGFGPVFKEGKQNDEKPSK